MARLGVLTAVCFGVLGAPALADETVQVGPTSTYNPKAAQIGPGESVTWNWAGAGHSVTSDPGQEPSFNSGVHSPPFTLGPVTFPSAGCFRYFCMVHGSSFGGGMAGVVLVGGATEAQCSQRPPPGGNPPGGGSPPPGGQPSPPGSGPPAAGTPDATSPRFSSVRGTPSAICTKRSDECRRPGLLLSFRLTEAATVTGRVELLRLARSSARTVKRLRLRGRAGSNRFRISGRGLKAGSYRLRLEAADRAGNKSRLASLRFRVK